MSTLKIIDHPETAGKRIQRFGDNTDRKALTGSFLTTVFMQPKLKIGLSNDKYERHADRVADAVMRMPDSQLQMQPIENEEEEMQMKPAIQKQEDNSDKKSMESSNYPELRRVEIRVQPAPVVVYDFPVNKAPGEKDVGPKEFIKKRIKAGDQDMIRAANDAGLITLAKKSLEDYLPSFSFTTSDEIQWEMTIETIRLYEKYREYEKEKYPDLNIPDSPSPTQKKKPDPEQNLYFAHDSTEFSELTTEEDWGYTVNQIISYLRNLKRAKNMNSKYQNVIPVISVRGYASPEGTGEYNQKLSDSRASIITERLADALTEAGFNFNDYVIYGIGSGEMRPELIIY